MMRSRTAVLLFAAVLGLTPAMAHASSLSVSPVSIQVAAPGATSSLTLENSGTDAITSQIRVYKWTQENGQDVLTPTKEVVASPPFLKLPAGAKNVVRVVRMVKSLVPQEDAYRLVVDELPKNATESSVGVGISLRYSLPVFFTGVAASPPALAWSASVSGGQIILKAENTGGRHMRLANLHIDSGGKTITLSSGLAGYVLQGSDKVWTIKNTAKFSPGTTVSVSAEGDNGPIKATAKLAAAK